MPENNPQLDELNQLRKQMIEQETVHRKERGKVKEEARNSGLMAYFRHKSDSLIIENLQHKIEDQGTQVAIANELLEIEKLSRPSEENPDMAALHQRIDVLQERLFLSEVERRQNDKAILEHNCVLLTQMDVLLSHIKIMHTLYQNAHHKNTELMARQSLLHKTVSNDGISLSGASLSNLPEASQFEEEFTGTVSNITETAPNAEVSSSSTPYYHQRQSSRKRSLPLSVDEDTSNQPLPKHRKYGQ